MSAAVAMAPSPAPHERGPFSNGDAAPAAETQGSSQNAGPRSSSTQRTVATSASITHKNGDAASATAGNATTSASKSPTSSSRGDLSKSKIVVKKEPGSPKLSNMKPRPRKLDLSKNTRPASGNPASAVPLTAREGLAIQEVGIACLSPGFSTHDPVMKEQLQRSLSVRDQQRSIIESRLQQSAKGDGPGDRDVTSGGSGFAAKTPGMSRRNKAPPGLSIVAPSHEQFANERVIQSAPLGHSFGRQHPVPVSRHVANQPSNLAGSSHIHHVPAHQTRNRLPPISDVFGHNTPAHSDNAPTSGRAHVMSPGHSTAQHYQQPLGSARGREYKSAEEAQQELAGGRPELIPKIVHYGGHQPPTPPSPVGGSRHGETTRSAQRRRTRAEYEDGASPPLGYGPSATRRGPFGEGRDSPETQRAKKDEFLRLCSRAWDLFHS